MQEYGNVAFDGAADDVLLTGLPERQPIWIPSLLRPLRVLLHGRLLLCSHFPEHAGHQVSGEAFVQETEDLRAPEIPVIVVTCEKADPTGKDIPADQKLCPCIPQPFDRGHFDPDRVPASIGPAV